MRTRCGGNAVACDSIEATLLIRRHEPPSSMPSSATLPEPARAAHAAGEPRHTGFGPTVFDSLAPSVPNPVVVGSVFDVCHVGVVLRGLLFVHTVVAVGVLFGAADVTTWFGRFTAAAGVALPAVLFWLLVACAARQPLGALRAPLQWAAATLLGAASAAASAWTAWLLMADAPASPPWLACALAGAGLAAAVFLWLQLRAQASLPADTTARLAELQSRIRPHFLFNTLNTALALVRLDPARAEGVLEDLAELFRVAISDSAESVTLAEEVELAKRYLAIEQIRFGERLQVTWELDPAAGAARMPPLLLQPLVENAVRHGVEPAAEGGVIRIRTRVRLGRAVVSIVNSVPAEPSRPGHGMALRNVRERLRLMHDVAAQFDTRREGAVFRVQVVVPL